MRFPELRVTRDGNLVKRVEWDPCVDGQAVFDLTGMHVVKVESEIGSNDRPAVKVTFVARIVEVEE